MSASLHTRSHVDGGPAITTLAPTFRDQACAELEHSIVPFWWRTIDRERGGVFNCIDNTGRKLVSRDKFTWSQGRFAWLCARLCDVTRRGLLRGNADEFLAQAGKRPNSIGTDIGPINAPNQSITSPSTPPNRSASIPTSSVRNVKRSVVTRATSNERR